MIQSRDTQRDSPCRLTNTATTSLPRPLRVLLRRVWDAVARARNLRLRERNLRLTTRSRMHVIGRIERGVRSLILALCGLHLLLSLRIPVRSVDHRARKGVLHRRWRVDRQCGGEVGVSERLSSGYALRGVELEETLEEVDSWSGS